MKNFYLLAVAVMLCLTTSLSAQVTFTLQPDADAGNDALLTSLPTQADRNFADNAQFLATAWTAAGEPLTVRSVVKFDLAEVPAGATITSARLSLYAWDMTTGSGPHSAQSGSNGCLIQRVTTDWDEETVTWNNQPSSTTQNQASIPASEAPGQDYEDIDVTALVQDMVDDPTGSFGFLLRLETEEMFRRMNFLTSDAAVAERRPKLTVTYVTEDVVSDQCVTLRPNAEEGKDALISSLPDAVDRNFGDNAQLLSTSWTAGGTPFTARSVIQFDLSDIPADATIDEASLALYAWGMNTGSGPHAAETGSNASWLQRITEDWDESTVTWNNQPSSVIDNRATIAASTSPTQDYEDINVTALVRDMIDNPDSSFGFLLRLQEEERFRRLNFFTSDAEDEAKRPQLTICYSIPTSTDAPEAAPSFGIYPNPANSFFTVSPGESSDLPFDLEVYTVAGSLVERRSEIRGALTVDVTDYPTGLYFVNMRIGNRVAVKKLMVR